jgi:hypothetical protein
LHNKKSYKPIDRKTILHAGFPKTGTTFIQNRIFNMRDVLKKNGILVPSIAANLTDALCTMFHDDPMVHITNKLDQLDDRLMKKRINYYFGELDRDIKSSSCETVVLSAEGVSNLSDEELLRLKQWGDEFSGSWKILYCVRSPIDWSRSAAQELMKGGRTIGGMVEDLPLPFYRGQIGTAIEVFGRESVHVYSYEEACDYPGGLLGHFLSLIGARNVPIPESEKQPEENQSMSQEAAMILDGLNSLRPLFDEEGGIGEGRTGQEIFNLLKIVGQDFRLPSQIEERVRGAPADDVQWLHDTFGVHFSAEKSGRRKAPTFGRKTTDALAILLSDLMNDLHYMTEKERLGAPDDAGSA